MLFHHISGDRKVSQLVHSPAASLAASASLMQGLVQATIVAPVLGDDHSSVVPEQRANADVESEEIGAAGFAGSFT